MAKHLIKRFTPNHEAIRNHRHLRVFGRLLHDPNLWHMNRRSAAGAFAVGLFMAFMPVPFQMVLAAGAAIIVRVNLPLSVALVWLSNPLTMGPIFYFAYLVGTAFLGQPPPPAAFDPADGALLSDLNGIWSPFLLGCLVCGAVSALLGYLVIRGLWRWHVIKNLRRRKRRIAARRIGAGSSLRRPPGTGVGSDGRGVR
jgi:uncharacterized protein (DUF2062 family)